MEYEVGQVWGNAGECSVEITKLTEKSVIYVIIYPNGRRSGRSNLKRNTFAAQFPERRS